MCTTLSCPYEYTFVALPRRIKADLGTFDRSMPSITLLKFGLEHVDDDDDDDDDV